ncbi:MAG: glycerol-3-phosphate 1-O-acyltransferase PlsY [Rhodospirillales bacterium]|nr:glycerol-3-phosphate 1-O-acyltransferase PlsY [Rhodospirillales bacterium]
MSVEALPFLWPYAVCALVAYLLGSIPFGLLITRWAGLGDIRKIGSGNIGATNVLRTGNKKLAALTVLLDAVKGAAAVLIAFDIGGPDFLVIASIAVMVGHMFPVWLKFRGGKAIATGMGVILSISWPAGLVTFAGWLLVVATTRYVSLGSIISSILSVIYIFYFTSDMQYVQTVAVLAVLTIIRHRSNIGRLFRGEEPKIGQKA